MSVTGAGLVTALGFNTHSTCAALRAGLSGVQSARLWDPEAGQPLRAARVPLPHWWEGLGKLAELVAPAIAECLRDIDPMSARKVPILIGIGEKTTEPPTGWIEDELLDLVASRLDIPRHGQSALIPAGRISVILGITRAAELVTQRQVPACVVAGVGSLISQDLVGPMVRRDRIICAGNSNGFFPGEAGAAIVVAPGRALDRWRC